MDYQYSKMSKEHLGSGKMIEIHRNTVELFSKVDRKSYRHLEEKRAER